MDAPLALDTTRALAPDPGVTPDGFVVLVEPQDRIHFLDWGGPQDAAAPAVLLIHGLAQTGWLWTPVARRLVRRCRVVAMDLRGHGLSDSPTTGYDEATLSEDAVAVADGSGLLSGHRLVLAGHGFGAAVAAWTAARLGDRCAGLVLVDGGWEDVGTSSGLTADEFLKTVEEPPEVLRSMRAFLADRAGFDPGTWDADQERAARATVVDTPAGRVVPATRPHALAGAVQALLEYRPAVTLAAVAASIVAVVAAEDEERTRRPALRSVQAALRAAGRPPIRAVDLGGVGHNVMRYRADAVAAAILAVAEGGID